MKNFQVEENFVINQSNINAYLKALESTYKKKKAPAFTKEEIFRYLAETPNESSYLVNKLFVLFSYFGALRVSEAYELKFSSVIVVDEGIMLAIHHKKTDKNGIGEVKLIPRNENPLLCPVAIFEQYNKEGPIHKRLWVKYDVD